MKNDRNKTVIVNIRNDMNANGRLVGAYATFCPRRFFLLCFISVSPNVGEYFCLHLSALSHNKSGKVFSFNLCNSPGVMIRNVYIPYVL